MSSVSIALATYNGQRHIHRQLESLAAQSRLPAELVITDDGSADDTLKIVGAFAKTAPFPVHIHCNDSRLGYRANFMRAASMCRSELIAFCDQDDYWYPSKIAELVKPFCDPEVLLAYHNADLVTEDGTRIGSLASFAARQPILEPLSSGPWWPFALGFTEVFRRSLMDLFYLWPKTLNQNFENEPLGHDRWVFILATVFGKIAYLNQPLVAHVQHGKNTFGFRKNTFLERMKKHFRDCSGEYESLAKASERLAVIFDDAKSDLEGIWAERAARGSEYYQMVGWLYSRRKAIYDSPNFSDRLNTFRAVFAKNGYAGAWGLSRKAFLVDACVGVLPIGKVIRASID